MRKVTIEIYISAMHVEEGSLVTKQDRDEAAASLKEALIAGAFPYAHEHEVMVKVVKVEDGQSCPPDAV